MNWLQRTCQLDPDALYDKAVQYFSIGHGDYDEEVGFEPKYIVWTYIEGRIEVGPEGYGDGVIQESDEDLPDGGTHGSLWGHEIADRTYKGRYEPETGRLSIVKPVGKEHNHVPSVIMQALYNEFTNITKVVEF